MDSHKLIPYLPAAGREKLERLLHDRTCSPGERIFAQDAVPEGIYFLAEGSVKIVRLTSEGHETVLCVRGPGEYFCPLTVLDGQGQLGSAIAMTPVRLLWAERAEFYELASEHEEIKELLSSACLAEIRHLVSRLETSTFERIQAKVIHALLAAVPKSGWTKPHQIRLTHQEIAGLAGTTRESASRVLSHLESEGLVRLARGRITIYDVDKLEKAHRA
ncbi:MAG: Crp/Fnr family transcriptional regulator [Rudaea sp.]